MLASSAGFADEYSTISPFLFQLIRPGKLEAIKASLKYSGRQAARRRSI